MARVKTNKSDDTVVRDDIAVQEVSAETEVTTTETGVTEEVVVETSVEQTEASADESTSGDAVVENTDLTNEGGATESVETITGDQSHIEATAGAIKSDITETSVENKKESPVDEAVHKELPTYVLQILKVFPQYPELYIDRKGSAYTTDLKPSLRGDAILYQNPFYNN